MSWNKFEDEELEALLEEDSCQIQEELKESLGVISKEIGCYTNWNQ